MRPDEAGWDSSTWKYVPHSLKGIKPVTNEPWARDEQVYNNSRNSVNRDESGEFTASEHFHFGRDGDGPNWDASLKPPDGAMQVYDP